MAPRGRRSQQERRDATQAALLDAAIDCLWESGLAGFTTANVCLRADLSQGALFRYFPNKTSLLAAMAEHLFAGLRATYEARFQELPEKHRTPREGVGLLWTTMIDYRLQAAYELYTAARTDRELREALEPIVRAHVARIHELAESLIPDGGGLPLDQFHAMVDLAILAMQGLVINRMPLQDYEQERRLLGMLEALVQTWPVAEAV